jgi:hypothetical protein
VEIVIKDDGRFLDLTGVPDLLKLRSGLRKYLYLRDCYDDFIKDILTSLPRKHCKTIAILGTAGIGKSSLFLVLLKVLLEDPTKLGLASRSFYYQTRQDKIRLYHHESGGAYSVRFVQPDEELDKSIILFADMETADGSPTEHAGISFIFTSFRPSRFKEITKNGWRKVMPTWSADEQAEYFNSTQFESEHGKEVAQRAYDNIQFFGGSIRSNIQVALSEEDALARIDEAILAKGELVCDRFFKAGFGGTEDVVSDVLVHRNPKMKEVNTYDFNAVTCAYSFASPYVLRRLLQLKDSMLVTEARAKYSAGTFRGGDDGNEFELLCLHGFKVSDVEFLVQPLTDGAQPTTVRFPAKQVLALNWRERENYLQVNVLYIPPYGNLESGDSFCLIKINERWTLVILQCTIAETHPVKQNGVKVIYDCYKKNPELKVDDTVIMFMIPVNGKLKTKQPMVTQKKGGVLEEVQRVTIAVSAQYKIENALVTVDAT